MGIIDMTSTAEAFIKGKTGSSNSAKHDQISNTTPIGVNLPSVVAHLPPVQVPTISSDIRAMQAASKIVPGGIKVIPPVAPAKDRSETTKQDLSKIAEMDIGVQVVDMVQPKVVDSFNPISCTKSAEEGVYKFSYPPTDIYGQFTSRLPEGIVDMNILVKRNARELKGRSPEGTGFHDVGFEFKLNDGNSAVSTIVCCSRVILGSLFKSQYSDTKTGESKINMKIGIPIAVHDVLESVFASLGYSLQDVERTNNFAWHRASPFGAESAFRISERVGGNNLVVHSGAGAADILSKYAPLNKCRARPMGLAQLKFSLRCMKEHSPPVAGYIGELRPAHLTVVVADFIQTGFTNDLPASMDNTHTKSEVVMANNVMPVD
eukprot:GDKJ01015997.1.p1 GENE.GDKJ01015997.1~~GDKJ01015997.1.p1  ORF type:complete len:376 (+),score=31.81 GDKJ01015997.1:1-1128(+)